MARSADEATVIEDFSRIYGEKRKDVWRQIECCVYGCEYGATSWTTREEADALGVRLALSPGKTFLEVGAGAGWPGLYLATSTGARAVLADLPFEGIEIARDRAREDSIAERCSAAVADGAELPFADSSFDAVFHSDVLCCMEAKRAMLKECRRVIRPDGMFSFLVLLVAPGLSQAEHEKAVSWGPPYIDTDTEYPAMMLEAGWEITEHIDITAAYYETTKTMTAEEKNNADALIELYGEDGYADRLAIGRARLAGVERGFIRREQFSAIPACPA